MGKLLDLISKFKGLNVQEVIEESVTEVKEDILDLQRQQLMEGKTSLGEDISPSYFEDPYFKTPESAARYSAWKDKITPSSIRKSGVPNLFIVGVFHRSIEIPGFQIQSPSSLGQKIIGKFDNVLGLNAEKRTVLNKEKLRPAVMRNIRKTIQL